MSATMTSVKAAANVAAMSSSDATAVAIESPILALIIALTAVAIVISNLFIIIAFVYFKGLTKEIINNYVLSLAVADLISGLLVVPFSSYTAFNGHWIFGESICLLVGYLVPCLWCASVYTFMWISVDRYLAIRKPLRYETIQSRTRSQCWMALSWVFAALFCCPPLLGREKEAVIDQTTLMCSLDWNKTYAYTATIALLVLGPSVITICYNYSFIFITKRKLSGALIYDKEYATALAEKLAHPSTGMSFALVAVFWVSWIPYIILCLYENLTEQAIDIPMLHFTVLWLGILNSLWKIIILITFNPQFRLIIKLIVLWACCRTKGPLRDQLDEMDNNE